MKKLCYLILLILIGVSAFSQSIDKNTLHIFIDVTQSQNKDVMRSTIKSLSETLPRQLKEISIARVIVMKFTDDMDLFKAPDFEINLPIPDKEKIEEILIKEGYLFSSNGKDILNEKIELALEERLDSLNKCSAYINGIEFEKTKCTAIKEMLYRLTFMDDNDMVIVLSDFKNECSDYESKQVGNINGKFKKSLNCLMFYIPSGDDNKDSSGIYSIFEKRKKEILEIIPNAHFLPCYQITTNWTNLITNQKYNLTLIDTHN